MAKTESFTDNIQTIKESHSSDHLILPPASDMIVGGHIMEQNARMIPVERTPGASRITVYAASSFGLKRNEYSSIFAQVVTQDDLFAE